MRQTHTQALRADYYEQQTSPLETRQTIERAAGTRLRRSGYHTVRSVSCRFRHGVLILEGRVPSYYLKQIAQTRVGGLAGVEKLDNRVQVVTPRALGEG